MHYKLERFFAIFLHPTYYIIGADVVTVYILQEPSLLSPLQENGLTDVVLQALLLKTV